MTTPAFHSPSVASAARESAVHEGARLTSRVAVLGASGYSGLEFVRLALTHPGIHLAALVSREHAVRASSEWIPGLDSRAATLPPTLAPAGVAPLLASGEVDTVVSCLPHGAWKALTAEYPRLAEATRVLDLSSDHRAGEGGYVYGLPEQSRRAISGASRVANPGCYATTGALALLPAAEAGWLAGPVMITALSGVTGAGRTPQLHTSFGELDGGASLYKVGAVHAHVAEMERTLAVAGATVAIGFAPQLVPMSRGILLTANASLPTLITPAEARAAYLRRYAGEPFVRVMGEDAWPATRAVRGSNRCDLAVTTLHGGRTLLVAAALDNLVKGAAGQALQNLNLMTGWPEDQGLARDGSPW